MLLTSNVCMIGKGIAMLRFERLNRDKIVGYVAKAPRPTEFYLLPATPAAARGLGLMVVTGPALAAYIQSIRVAEFGARIMGDVNPRLSELYDPDGFPVSISQIRTPFPEFQVYTWTKLEVGEERWAVTHAPNRATSIYVRLRA
jgi:hypothetical protein